MELERIKGIYKGNHQNVKQDNLTSQSGLAEELNISRQQLQDYKKLTNLIPELQQMIENGSIKQSRVISEYERLCDVKQGRQKNGTNFRISQDQVAYDKLSDADSDTV